MGLTKTSEVYETSEVFGDKFQQFHFYQNTCFK